MAFLNTTQLAVVVTTTLRDTVQYLWLAMPCTLILVQRAPGGQPWLLLDSLRVSLLNTFTPTIKKYILPTFLKTKCISEVVRIGNIIISHLSKLGKAKFFILCDVIFLVRLQGKFDIDHSWE